jgi:hypothetical protein
MFPKGWLRSKFQGSTQSKRGRVFSQKRRRSASLAVEQLECREAPVVGTFAIPAAVAPGTGYDGVVLLTSNAGLGSGSLLFDGRHILTAAHVVVPDEVQQIALAGNPTGGTFRLTFDGRTTVPIPFNAPASGGAGPAGSVQNALQALSTIGADNVNVSGNAGGPWTVNFVGQLAGKDVSQIVGNGAALTGGAAPSVRVTTQLNGGGVVTNLKVRFDMPGASGPQSGVTQGPGGITIDIPAADITTNPDYNPATLKNDIAIVTLPVVAPYRAEHYDIYRNYDEVGQNTTIVGYGRTGIGDPVTAAAAVPPIVPGEQAGTSGTKRLGTNAFTDTEFAPLIGRARGLTANFNIGLGAGGGAVGAGDSGGPAFIGGTQVIAGVNDSGTGTTVFGDTSGFTRVSYFASWIDNTIKGPYDLVLDMNKQVLGVNAARNENVTIVASLNGPNLQLQVAAPTGQLTGVYYSAPVADIRSLTIRGGDDNEKIRIVGPLGLDTINVDGGTGNSTLTLDYSAAATANYTVTNTTVTRGTGTITYGHFTSLTLSTGTSANTSDWIYVRGTAAGTNTTINVGASAVTKVGTVGNGLDGIHVTVNGGRVLNITNVGWAGPETHTITATTYSIASHGQIVAYNGVKNFVLAVGNGANVINVDSTAAGTSSFLHGGTGATSTVAFKLVNVGFARGIQGPVSVYGNGGTSKSLVIDNSNVPSRASYALDASGLTVGTQRLVNYYRLTSVDFWAGAGNNTIDIRGTAAGTATTVSSGPQGGDDIYVANANSRLDGIKVTVHGLGGGNALNISNTGWAGAETHTITATTYSIASHGQIVGFDGIAKINLNCGSGPDTINYVDFPGVAVLDGGPGPGSNTVVVSAGGALDTGLVELRNMQTLQINGGTVTVNRDLRIQNFILTSGTLTGPGTLTVLKNQAGVFGPPINATWSGGTMSGTGRTVISAGAVLSITGAANKTLRDRAIVNDGSAASFGPGPVVGGNGSLDNQQTGTFGAAGTFTGNISNSGKFAPGADRQNNFLLDRGNFTQTATGRFDVTLHTPPDSTQLRVTGTVKLDGTLNVTTLAGFAGNSFTIINNLGPAAVIGTFKGLPEGTVLMLAGSPFQITYVGGKGHDVVLHRVSAQATNLKLDSSLNPSVYGQWVAFTATVSAVNAGNGIPTGSVQFYVDGTTFGAPVALTAGVAKSNSVNTLTAGPHRIIASYTPTGNFRASASTLSQTVNKAPLTITADNQSKVYGAAMPMLTVSYSGFVNGDTPASLTAPPTVTTMATSRSPVGSYPITASGAVAANYTISYVTGSLTVTQASTVTAIAANSSTSVFGEPIYFAAAVVAVPPGAGSSTGTVAFKGVSPDGTIVVTLGTGTLNASGTAVFVMDHFVPSTQRVFAVYLGDNNFTSSTAPTITHTINRASTTLALSSSNLMSFAGQAVQFTATLGVVTPGSRVVPATGTITFYDMFHGSKTVLSTITIGGSAGTSPSFTAAGTHEITAEYSGDSDFIGSTAAAINQVVSPAAATHLLLVAAQGTIYPGVAFAMTITALDAYGNTATSYRGTIHFTCSDPQASVPANVTFTAADNGVLTVSGFVLRSPADQTFTATDTLTLTIMGTAFFRFMVA